jgi:hypothetical protein
MSEGFVIFPKKVQPLLKKVRDRFREEEVEEYVAT